MPRKGTVLSEDAAERQREAIKRWHEENTTTICIRVRKEKYTAYKELSKRTGKSLSSLIQDALDAMITEPFT